MKIYLINGTERDAVDAILGGEISESLSGEQVISLQLYGADAERIGDDTIIEYDGQYYDVSAYTKSGNSTEVICDVSGEHVSYRLNLAEYDVESFAFGGSYADLLARILSGTDFEAGAAPAGSVTGFVVEGASRRELLMTAAETIGCEVEYDGYRISYVRHRGSTVRINLIETHHVSEVSVNHDIVSGTTSYGVAIGARGGLQCGDEIRLLYAPLALDINTRVVAIHYNPYKESECRIDVGDYIADIVDAYTDLTRRVLLKADAKIEFEKYINSADGKSAISAAMSGTYVTADMLGEYATVSQIDARIEAYIDGQEGTAKIVENLIGTFVTENDLGDYATKKEVSTQIYQEINSIDAKISLEAEYGSGTIGSNVRAMLTLFANADSSNIQLKANAIDLSGYVTVTALNTPGATIINGANVTTDNLYVRKIYGTKGADADYEDIAIISSAGRNIAIGNGGTTGLATNLTIWANNISFASKNTTQLYTEYLVISTVESDDVIDGISYRYPCCIYPYNVNGSSATWEIGNEDYPFGKIYLDNSLYLYDRDIEGWARIYSNNNHLYFVDAGGDRTTLV